MPSLIITTTCRNASASEPSGHIYVFDPTRARIIQKGSIIEPPFRDVDPNPRGGLRGGKGIAIRGGDIFLANSVAVFRFNQNWDLQGVITHPACAGIHDVMIDRNDCLLVSSARNDLLFKFDLQGTLLEYIDFRREPGLLQSLAWNQPGVISEKVIASGEIDFRDPRSHELTVYDGAHINSVCQLPDGKLLVSLGFVVNRGYSSLMAVKTWLVRRGWWSGFIHVNSILRQALALKKDMHSNLVVPPARGRCAVLLRSEAGIFDPCLTIHNATAPAHSLLAMPDGIGIYLNTTTGEIIQFDPDKKTILSADKITDKFLRGVTMLSEEMLVVGAQNGVILYNRTRRRIVEHFQLSENAGESVFAIQSLEDEFSLPPVSFEERFGKLAGFQGRDPIFQ